MFLETFSFSLENQFTFSLFVHQVKIIQEKVLIDNFLEFIDFLSSINI